MQAIGRSSGTGELRVRLSDCCGFCAVSGAHLKGELPFAVAARVQLPLQTKALCCARLGALAQPASDCAVLSRSSQRDS